MSSDADAPGEWWERWMRLNEEYTDAAEGVVAAQGRILDAWADSVDEATRQEDLDEGMDAALRAHEVWMGAAQDAIEQANDVLEGEEVPVERFRDTWLNAANRAFKETMQTTAFARATGRSVDDVLELQRQVDEAAEATLHELRLPAKGDVEEVGERLVELERRHHDLSRQIAALERSQETVAERLDRVLDAVEDGVATDAGDSSEDTEPEDSADGE